MTSMPRPRKICALGPSIMTVPRLVELVIFQSAGMLMVLGAVADGLILQWGVGWEGGGEFGDVSWRGIVAGVEDGDGCAFVAYAADDGAFDGLAFE